MWELWLCCCKELDEALGGQLFYMRSRGIPEPVARRMLLRSFLDEALEGLRSLDWLKGAVEKILDERLLRP